ncbi:DUF6339 family protein [Gammaproteobacteria bacterium]|nr:DUF6339 family protein [Gammaproteobacteria bacterium]
MSISLLSQSSVDYLRHLASQGVDILGVDFDELVSTYDLSILSVNYHFKDNFDLKVPEGSTQELNGDIENCLQLSKILPDLDDIDATDERLWVTLALREFKQYSISRWPLKGKNDDPNKHLLNHWFAKGTRALMRDHAISRLWWYQRLCERMNTDSKEETLKMLLFNSDYRSSMLERNTTSAISEVVSVIVEITHEYKSKGVQYNRDKFRDFMKELDLIAGRSHLAVLSRHQLYEKIKVLYLESMT